MSYILGQLLYDVFDALGQATTFMASGGTNATAVNTGTGYTQSNLTGTLIVRETTDAAAPQNEFSAVTAFAQSTGTFTFSPVVSAAIASGDKFAFCSPLYPTYQMIESINAGLRSLGDLVLVDTTTLDTASNQTEYTAAVAWKRRSPYRIDLQGNTSDADDNRWYQIDAWEYIPATAGSTGLIVFNDQLTPSRDIRIWYEDLHPRVEDYDDVIAEVIHPELAVAACAEKAAEWQKNRTQSGEPGIVKAWNDAVEKKAEMLARYPIWKPRRQPKLFRGRGTGDYPITGEPNKVRLE